MTGEMNSVTLSKDEAIPVPALGKNHPFKNHWLPSTPRRRPPSSV